MSVVATAPATQDMPTSPLLQICNMALGYADHRLFGDLSLDLAPGAPLAVLGPNGSGKSTFLKFLLGLVAPLAGQLTWPGGRPREIGYLAQMRTFDPCFPLRVKDLAAMGAWNSAGWRGHLGPMTQARVEAALGQVGLASMANKSLHTLSGGQLQRALFARLIVQDAPLILLDEPFAAVDQRTEARLLTLIDAWRAEGRCLVLVVHDLSSVLDHCSHALLLGAGQASHGPVASIVTRERLVAQNYLSPNQAAWIFDQKRLTPKHNHD